jgi:hypothetical protein
VKFLPILCTLLALGANLPGIQAQTTSSQSADQSSFPANYKPEPNVIYTSTQGSTYVPVDSWIYPALDRLHGLGYLDTAFLGLRPWTRLSIAHMLQLSADQIDASNSDEAREIYLSVLREVQPDIDDASAVAHPHAELDSAYTQFRGISGTPLRDSYNLGQTLINDYGRPYQAGFNNYSGFSARAEAGRFSLYYRGEYQRAPGATGYSLGLSEYLSNLLGLNFATDPSQATIPTGPIATANNSRVLEANLSYHILNHEISFGKNDHWMGPAKGASMLWGNNAEDIYDFEINRIEPLRIPLLSRVTGPFRYDFFVGSLKGHVAPNDPWTHVEKVSFKPTRDLEFGFDRMVVWGGKGHGCINPQTGVRYACNEPITLHTFLKSFFSIQNVSGNEKLSRDDPGARFGTFDFNYRLPFMRNWLTLYSDSLVHDDVSPISAPRRSGLHPGLYLSHFPAVPHLDLRVEAASTDPTSTGEFNGLFLQYETVQKQGPTNKGFLVGDPIGREGKGGQAWLTYHLSPQEDIQFSYRNAKASRAFFTGGSTQNDYEVSVTKRFLKDIEVRAWVQYEGWKAPIYKPGYQSDTTATGQITWYPHHEEKQF